jgi:hypothetical protein
MFENMDMIAKGIDRLPIFSFVGSKSSFTTMPSSCMFKQRLDAIIWEIVIKAKNRDQVSFTDSVSPINESRILRSPAWDVLTKATEELLRNLKLCSASTSDAEKACRSDFTNLVPSLDAVLKKREGRLGFDLSISLACAALDKIVDAREIWLAGGLSLDECVHLKSILVSIPSEDFFEEQLGMQDRQSLLASIMNHGLNEEARAAVNSAFKLFTDENCLRLFQVPKMLLLKEFGGLQLFYVKDMDEDESFLEKVAKEGSFYAFHGSCAGNWPSITKNGLKNYSGTERQKHGSAHGNGIYLAKNFRFSLKYSSQAAPQIGGKRRLDPQGGATWSALKLAGTPMARQSGGSLAVSEDVAAPATRFALDPNFCIVGLFEVAGRPADYLKSQGIFVVPNEKCVKLRLLVVKTSGVSAQDLLDVDVTTEIFGQELRSMLAGII